MPASPRLLRHYPFTTVRVACRPCGRAGCYGLARLAEAHGADMPLVDLLLVLTAACRSQRRPGERAPRPYEPRCVAFFPDLEPPSLPPDAPAGSRDGAGRRSVAIVGRLADASRAKSGM